MNCNAFTIGNLTSSYPCIFFFQLTRKITSIKRKENRKKKLSGDWLNTKDSNSMRESMANTYCNKKVKKYCEWKHVEAKDQKWIRSNTFRLKKKKTKIMDWDVEITIINNCVNHMNGFPLKHLCKRYIATNSRNRKLKRQSNE